MSELNDTYLTLNEVAKILKINNRAVMRLVKSKKLKAFKPSIRKAYFTPLMIKEYLNDK